MSHWQPVGKVICQYVVYIYAKLSTYIYIYIYIYVCVCDCYMMYNLYLLYIMTQSPYIYICK